MLDRLHAMIAKSRKGEPCALVSVCSAHPDVLRASLNWAERGDRPLIIETTSNQVNQEGGYTGTTPAQFATEITELADRLGVARERLILGGDHLGPQVWRGEGAAQAMEKARVLVRAYVAAGYEKIHLDCSQGCAGDGEPLSDALIAERSAELAVACEQASDEAGTPPPVYIIGTEVPVPGGATVQSEPAGSNTDQPEDTITATTPAAAHLTLQAHQEAFEAAGLSGVLARIVGLVVQPGVEFAPLHVHHLPMDRDPGLRSVAQSWSSLVLEAHSTDYQHPAAFHRLAELGFGFQKVGPALTFAMRQALYALDTALGFIGREIGLFATMENLMLAHPGYWQGHYAVEDRLARHFGLSDRVRYYWAQEPAQRAVHALRDRVQSTPLPEPLLLQVFDERVLERAEQLSGGLDQRLIDASIELALDPYDLSGAVQGRIAR